MWGAFGKSGVVYVCVRGGAEREWVWSGVLSGMWGAVGGSGGQCVYSLGMGWVTWEEFVGVGC